MNIVENVTFSNTREALSYSLERIEFADLVTRDENSTITPQDVTPLEAYDDEIPEDSNPFGQPTPLKEAESIILSSFSRASFADKTVKDENIPQQTKLMRFANKRKYF